MKILVTGFEPFGKDSLNPSSMVLSSLPSTLWGCEIDTLCLNVEATKAEASLKQQLTKGYDGVILLGVARGRSNVTIERVAINIDDYRIPDNDGNTRQDLTIVEDGPAAYFSTLPYREMERVLQEHQIPCAISNSAGTYLCNHMFYVCAHESALNNPNCKLGFVHVPAIPTMVVNEAVASMSMEMIEKAVLLMVKTLILSFCKKVAVSACLCGKNCKYNGGNNLNESLMVLLKNHECIEVCPEVQGGMSTPRIPSEQLNDKVINQNGEDVTAYFEKGASDALNDCLESQVDLAILKSRSPSCGINEVYDGTFSKKLILKDGVFVQKLRKTAILLGSSDE